MICDQDEKCHVPGPEVFWNESYYFNFFDHTTGHGGFTRIGMSPNQKSPNELKEQRGLGDMILCLYLPDGKLAIVKDYVPIAGNPEHVQVGALTYECEKPMDTWRLTYQGNLYMVEDADHLRDPLTLPLRAFEQVKVKIDLRFHRINPPLDYHDGDGAFKRSMLQSPSDFLSGLKNKSIPLELLKLFPRLASLRSMGHANHYEQTGRYEGQVTVGRKTYAFNGTGQRDRSWGTRDFRVPARWHWCSGQFGQGANLFAFNVCQVEFLLIRVIGGFVYEKGENYIIDDFVAETSYEADGVTQRRLEMKIRYGGHNSLDVLGEVKSVAPLVSSQGIYRIMVNEAMTIYTCRGKSCYGISEYLFQR